MTTIPHSRPTLPTGDEWAEVTGQLAPGWAADGPCLERFSREAAAWLGCEHGFAVNSGTSALHLALLAAGVGPGAEVLIPSYCCAALLNAVALAGASPILVDVEPSGFNICPVDAARRLTARAGAVVVAHMFGTPARTADFLTLGVPVIEDCAQSLGARTPAGPCGAEGLISIGSFYATKVITTGHGGLVATRDPKVSSFLADLLQYDNRDDWRPRFNYGLGETAAALGLWQLQRLRGFLDRRACIARHYDSAFGREANGTESSISYRYALRVPDATSAIQALNAAAVGAKRPVYRPLHRYLGGSFPHTEAAHGQIVSLPIYPTLSDDDVDRVIAVVRAAAIMQV